MMSGEENINDPGGLKAISTDAAQLQLFFLRNSGLPVMPRLPQEIIISRGMESCVFKSCMSFVVGKFGTCSITIFKFKFKSGRRF